MSTVQETRIYVGNISPDTTKTALREAFEKAGNVSKLRVLQRRRKTIVYAFITFETANEAKKAIGDLNDAELDGNKIIVQEARPIEDEVLAKRKEAKKNNRKLKRQAQQQAKKEEAAKKEQSEKEESKSTDESKPKKKNNRKGKGKKEEDNASGEKEVKSEPTKKDASTAAATTKSPEPAKKEVKKEETKSEATKKETKPEAKKEDAKAAPKKEEAKAAEKKKEVVNNKTPVKPTSDKEKPEEKKTATTTTAAKPEQKKKEESKEEEASSATKSSRISSETGVFVANLPFSAKTSDLQELFKNFNIKSAKIARGRQSRRSKGYGFVEAASVKDKEKILEEFKEVEFKERIITVKPLVAKSNDE